MLQMSNPSNPLGVNASTNSCDQSKESPQSDPCLMTETHNVTNRGDKSPRLHCCCDKALCLFGRCDISHEFKPV